MVKMFAKIAAVRLWCGMFFFRKRATFLFSHKKSPTWRAGFSCGIL